MLQNKYLVAKIGVDPAENVPFEVSLIPAQYQCIYKKQRGTWHAGWSERIRKSRSLDVLVVDVQSGWAGFARPAIPDLGVTGSTQTTVLSQPLKS